MEGKRVGVKFGATSHFFYNAIVDRYQVDRSKIEEVSIGKDVVQLLDHGTRGRGHGLHPATKPSTQSGWEAPST